LWLRDRTFGFWTAPIIQKLPLTLERPLQLQDLPIDDLPVIEADVYLAKLVRQVTRPAQKLRRIDVSDGLVVERLPDAPNLSL
jgi:hypothetical protein